MPDVEQLRPLTEPSRSSSPPPVAAPYSTTPPPSFFRRHRCLVCTVTSCSVILVLLAITILILALTVFRVKDPVLNVDSITLSDVSLDFKDSLSLNATVTADVSIKNPNAASFRFENSTTEFSYDGHVVGVAYAPSGVARARRTVRMNVTVDVLVDNIIQTNATTAVIKTGEVAVESYTDIGGKVDVLGIVKKWIDIKLNCTINLGLSLTKQEVRSKDCRVKVFK